MSLASSAGAFDLIDTSLKLTGPPQSSEPVSTALIQRHFPSAANVAGDKESATVGGSSSRTVTVDSAVPTFEAASRKRKVTAVARPSAGKTCVSVTSAPPTCGGNGAGAGSTRSAAEPAARNAARSADVAFDAPPGSEQA